VCSSSLETPTMGNCSRVSCDISAYCTLTMPLENVCFFIIRCWSRLSVTKKVIFFALKRMFSCSIDTSKNSRGLCWCDIKFIHIEEKRSSFARSTLVGMGG
jgi:hypothetical protein